MNVSDVRTDTFAGLSVDGEIRNISTALGGGQAGVFVKNAAGTVGSVQAQEFRLSESDAGSIHSLFGTGIVARSDLTVIDSSGAIVGGARSGIETVGALTLRNSGLVSGEKRAIFTSSDELTSIYNAGSILGRSVTVDLQGSGRLDVIDTGEFANLAGSISAIVLDGDAQGDALTNSGQMTGEIRMRDGGDSIANDGTILGDVLMGGGNDTVRNTGRILGDVDFGAGSDALDNSGVISGRVGTDAISLLHIQNTGQITGGLTDLFGLVQNDRVLGADIPETPFSAAVEMNGTLITTGRILGNLFKNGFSTLVNQGSITGIFDFTGDVLNMVNVGTGRDVLVTGSSLVNIANDGDLVGTFAASGSSVDVSNSGRMGGGEVFGTAIAEVSNTGLIASRLFVGGGVSLGNGAETFRMTGDGTVGGLMEGRDGNDTIHGGRFDDHIDGGRQVDDLRGGDGDDVIFGDSGNDRMMGQNGNDDMNGGG